MRESADELETLAIKLLDQFAESGQNLAQLMLLRDIPVLKDEFCLFTKEESNLCRCSRKLEVQNMQQRDNSPGETSPTSESTIEAQSNKNSVPLLKDIKSESVKGRTCLDLSRRAFTRKFVSDAAVQNLVDNIFYGQIEGPEGKNRLWFTICGLFIFTLPIVFKFLIMRKDRKEIKFTLLNKLVINILNFSCSSIYVICMM